MFVNFSLRSQLYRQSTLCSVLLVQVNFSSKLAHWDFASTVRCVVLEALLMPLLESIRPFVYSFISSAASVFVFSSQQTTARTILPRTVYAKLWSRSTSREEETVIHISNGFILAFEPSTSPLARVSAHVATVSTIETCALFSHMAPCLYRERCR